MCSQGSLKFTYTQWPNIAGAKKKGSYQRHPLQLFQHSLFAFHVLPVLDFKIVAERSVGEVGSRQNADIIERVVQDLLWIEAQDFLFVFLHLLRGFALGLGVEGGVLLKG